MSTSGTGYQGKRRLEDADTRVFVGRDYGHQCIGDGCRCNTIPGDVVEPPTTSPETNVLGLIKWGCQQFRFIGFPRYRGLTGYLG